MQHAQSTKPHLLVWHGPGFSAEVLEAACDGMLQSATYTRNLQEVLQAVADCSLCLVAIEIGEQIALDTTIVEKIRQSARSFEVSVIALCQTLDDEFADAAYAAGFDDALALNAASILRMRMRNHVRSAQAVARHLSAREELCKINSELENIVSDRTTELRDFNDKLQNEVFERRLAEEAGAIKEAQLIQIIDLVPHFIFAKNAKGDFIIVNKAVADAYGVSVKELLHKRNQEFHPENEEMSGYLNDDAQVIKSGNPKFIPEESFTDFMGRKRYLQTTKIPLTLAGHDDPVVLGVAIDISEQKRTHAKLRERDDRLRMLANQMPAMIWTTDDKLRATSYSGAGLRHFGVRPRDNTRVPLRLFFAANRHKTDQPDVPMRMLQKVLRDRASVNFELRWEKRYLDVHLAPMLDSNGNLLGTIGMALDITIKFKAEQEIRERDVILDNVRRLTNLAMISINFPDRNLNGSAEFNQIVGMPEGEEMYNFQQYLEMVLPEDRNILVKAIEDPDMDLGRRPIYHRIKSASGNLRHLNAQFDAIRDSDGNTIRLLGLFTDITKRKAVETELQRSETRFSDIVNTVGEAIVAFNAQRKIVIFNAAAETTFNYTSEEVLGQSFDSLLPSHESGRLQKQLNTLTHSGAALDKRRAITCVRKNGQAFMAEINYSLLEVTNEQLYVAVLRDVTVRVKAERELQNVNEQLAAINKELRQFIDAANAPIFGIDRLGSVNEWNRRAEQITGFTREELMGRDAIDMLIAPEAKLAVNEILRAALNGIETDDYELPVITSTKERVILLLNATARRDAVGEIIGVIGVGQDITERIRATAELSNERVKLADTVERRTKELRTANRQLARANQMKDDFLANMSHELRTPLNTILGMSESLIDGIYGAVNERQSTAIGHIEQSGSHLLALINDILDLSKIGADKLELEISSVSVPAICDASLMFIRKFADEKNITLKTDFSNTVQQLQADELRLKQILVNLLNNAVKFTEEGGEIGLRVSDLQKGRFVKFEIWDSGIGIEAQHLENLFQPFMQIDNKLARRFPGTGLGLSLVYRLTRMHGGKVLVDSKPDVGSRFSVVLPKEQDELLRDIPAQLPIQSSFVEPQQIAASGKNGSSLSPELESEVEISMDTQPLVLLAEDNEQTINTITEYLRAKNLRVINASDGVMAVELAKKHLPDVILMDIQMPRLSGLDAIRLIRKDQRTKSTLLIALTAFAMRGDRERCLEAGADQYLSKPVRLQQLHQLIVSSLD